MYKGKDWFIREVAKRADFTVDDIRIIWKVMQSVIFESALESVRRLEKSQENQKDDSLILGGLFGFRVTKIRPHIGFDATRRKRIDVGDTYRYVFKPSRKFANMIKNELKNLRSEE